VQVDAGSPQRALYVFTTFYGVCILLNGWNYGRRRQARP
jgi:hypothetical protein